MNVLAIGAHPDDLEIGCGGTLALFGQRGDTVVMCHIASGGAGHKTIEPDQLKQIRRNEAKSAAKLIRAESFTLNEEDLFIRSDDMALREKVVDLIREVKPDLIITHDPSDYMDDHEETSRLVYRASMAATVGNYKTRYEAYPKLTPIYYMEPLCGVGSLPTEFVDITDVIELKLNMLKAHSSQIEWLRDHDNIDFVHMVETMARFRGYQCDTGFAEGFTSRQTYHKLTTRRLLP